MEDYYLNPAPGLAGRPYIEGAGESLWDDICNHYLDRTLNGDIEGVGVSLLILLFSFGIN